MKRLCVRKRGQEHKFKSLSLLVIKKIVVLYQPPVTLNVPSFRFFLLQSLPLIHFF